jgi:addiction module HigA family antidote
MLKRNLPPVHPGEILREDYINEHHLTITEVAEGLGVARANLSAIINGRAGISPEMAVKLAVAFGNTPQFWMNLQKNYELWHAERNVNRANIRHFWREPTPTA